VRVYIFKIQICSGKTPAPAIADFTRYTIFGRTHTESWPITGLKLVERGVDERFANVNCVDGGTGAAGRTKAYVFDRQGEVLDKRLYNALWPGARHVRA
jgi:hypothetical protein